MAEVNGTIAPGRADQACEIITGYQLIITLVCSIVIMAVLSILERRNNPAKCFSLTRGGLIVPVNLLGEDSKRTWVAAAFGVTASGSFDLIFPIRDISIDFNIPTWARILVILAYVLLYGLLFYPMFVCITTKWTLLGALFGMIYTSIRLGFDIAIIECTIVSYTDELYMAAVVGTSLPTVICELILVGYFTLSLVKAVLHLVKTGSACDEPSKPGVPVKQWHRDYVRRLLLDTDRDLRRVSDILRYKFDPTFKYSSRIIAVFTVSLICLYQCCLILLIFGTTLKRTVDAFAATLNTTDLHDTRTLYPGQLYLLYKVTIVASFVSFPLSALFSLGMMAHILVNYRALLLRMYRGDFTYLPFKRTEVSANAIMSNSLCYAGSQIANTVWGFILPFLGLLVLCYLVAYVIILPIMGKTIWSFGDVANFASVYIIMIALGYGRLFLSRLFLQKTDVYSSRREEVMHISVLALDNVKTYHIVSYFLFFLYIILGFFGNILHIVKAMALGVIFQSRLDKCRLLRGFETWDKAHMFYASFLHLEYSQRHPVMLVFCDLLNQATPKTSGELRDVTASFDEIPDSHADVHTFADKESRAVRRWWKAYTLVRNPSLVQLKNEVPLQDNVTSA